MIEPAINLFNHTSSQSTFLHLTWKFMEVLPDSLQVNLFYAFPNLPASTIECSLLSRDSQTIMDGVGMVHGSWRLWEVLRQPLSSLSRSFRSDSSTHWLLTYSFTLSSPCIVSPPEIPSLLFAWLSPAHSSRFKFISSFLTMQFTIISPQIACSAYLFSVLGFCTVQ